MAIRSPRRTPLRVAAEILRFGAVGAIATVTHLAIFVALIEYWQVAPSLANLCAFAAAVAIGYLGHAGFTFPRPAGSPRDHPRALGRFLVTAIAGLAMNAAIVAVTVDWLRRSHWLAVLLMATLTPACVYLLSRQWVFAVDAANRGGQDRRS